MRRSARRCVHRDHPTSGDGVCHPRTAIHSAREHFTLIRSPSDFVAVDRHSSALCGAPKVRITHGLGFRGRLLPRLLMAAASAAVVEEEDDSSSRPATTRVKPSLYPPPGAVWRTYPRYAHVAQMRFIFLSSVDEDRTVTY